MLITCILLVLEVCNVKPRYRKSWAGNLLMWSDFTLSPSFKVKRGQPNLKGFITRLLLILEVCNVKPTCRILWAGNLLMSDLTFGPSFKVKRWFNGFVSCLPGGYRFASVFRCIGRVIVLTFQKYLNNFHPQVYFRMNSSNLMLYDIQSV